MAATLSGGRRVAEVPGARRAGAVAALAVATLAAFAGVVRNDWILLDDPLYVYENPHVMHGFTAAGIRWSLTEPHGGNWHPLTSWSHMLDVQLFGLVPGAHHAVSLGLHVANAVLLLLVLFALTGAWWRSAVVAGLFALHPLRVESVAWVAERKDVLSGLFFLLTIGAYARWARKPGRGRWTLVLVCAALGLMAKPMLVTLPFVLLLLDVWPLRRSRPAPPAGAARGGTLRQRVAEKWALFALAAASATITFLVQRKAGAVVSMGHVSAGRRFTNAAISCWRYVGKTLWPSGLAPFYPFNHAADPIATAASVVGLALVTWLVVRERKRRPYLVVGWLWYLGMLVPVIGLVQVGGQAYADRYTYLPTIGLVIALVWGIGEWAARSRARAIGAATAALVAMIALGVATARQVALWRNTATLFTHTLLVTRDNPVAHYNLGDVLLKAGDPRAAVPHYAEAVRLAPEFGDAHNKLGSALGALGRNDEAIAELQLALQTSNTADVHHNLGFAYAKEGRIDDALREFQAALALDPDHELSLVHFGAALGAANRLAESETPLRHALALDPGNLEARRLLAVTLTRENRVEEAIHEYGEILRANPDDLDALINVAWVRATHADAAHRDGAEAVRLAERARDHSGDPFPVLYSTLAAAYAEAGRFDDAVRAGGRALALADSTRDSLEASRDAERLRLYRAGKPFHFTP